MRKMNLSHFVCFIFFLMSSIVTPNALSEQYTRWGLPAGAKAAIRKGQYI